MGRLGAPPAAARHRAAAVLDPGPARRGRHPAHLRPARHGVLTFSPLAGGWLSGRWRKDSDLSTPSPARQRLANRYDLSLLENLRKLEAAEALGQLAEDAGVSLIEMAIAFVLNHPAVTSAIMGPRTVQHLESQLPAADLHLPTDVLDRIDQIVTPGSLINPADSSYANPALEPSARKRP